MSQCYIIADIDRKEMLDPSNFGQSMELTKFAFRDNPLVMALMNLMGRSWKGDRVYVIGEHADKTPKEPWAKTHQALTKDLGCDKDRNLLNWCLDCCVSLSPVKACSEDLGWRYIFNHATKQFIDLEHCPPFKKEVQTALAPLPILLAMGNVSGRGDYYGVNHHLVGCWCSTSEFIEVRKTRFPGEDYSELLPNFSLKQRVVGEKRSGFTPETTLKGSGPGTKA